jgi:hypothetical protein
MGAPCNNTVHAVLNDTKKIAFLGLILQRKNSLRMGSQGDGPMLFSPLSMLKDALNTQRSFRLSVYG